MGRKCGAQFDKAELRRLFRFSPPYSEFWKIIREELTKVGRWKRKARGDPRKGWEEAKRRQSQ